MPSLNAIPPAKLVRLIGTPGAPALVDVRATPERLVPSAVPISIDQVRGISGGSNVLICEDGGAASQGAAALLRANGAEAEILDGGFAAWQAAGLPIIDAAKLPPRDAQGRTAWVSRARPKVDRVACPWLIRRFVDPNALFLFVSPAEVGNVAAQFNAAPFDVDGAFWGHRGERCTVDALVEELGLGAFEAVRKLAEIVRGADTGNPGLTPQSAGLLAASLGLSRMYADDLEQVDAGMILYDALYRWCRDAVDETHDIESHRPKARMDA
jgi:rhodanese-related sulfurtransferase